MIRKQRHPVQIPNPRLRRLLWVAAGILLFLGFAAIGALGLVQYLNPIGIEADVQVFISVYARSVLTAPIAILLAIFIFSLAVFGGMGRFLTELDDQVKTALFGTGQRRMGFLLGASLVLLLLWGHVVFALTVIFWLVN